jgi:hypothetical protein
MPEYSSLSDFYNNAPPTPNATERTNLFEAETPLRHSRHRPPLMPLKTAMRKPSNTGTTNSSSSDLRLTPQTPSLRFADPLAHYAVYQGGHPSVYLRQHDSNGQNDKRPKQSFSEFNVGTKNSVKQVKNTYWNIQNTVCF